MGCGQDVTLDHEWGRTDPPFFEFGRSPKSPNQSPFLSSVGEKKVGMEDGHWAMGSRRRPPFFGSSFPPPPFVTFSQIFFLLPFRPRAILSVSSSREAPTFSFGSSFPELHPVRPFGFLGRWNIHTTEYSHKNIPSLTGKCFNLLKEGTPYASFSQHTCPWQLLR